MLQTVVECKPQSLLHFINCMCRCMHWPHPDECRHAVCGVCGATHCTYKHSPHCYFAAWLFFLALGDPGVKNMLKKSGVVHVVVVPKTGAWLATATLWLLASTVAAPGVTCRAPDCAWHGHSLKTRCAAATCLRRKKHLRSSGHGHCVL